MALYAVEDIDDALDATRAFLLPFDLGRWLRLALVAFFVGGTGTGSGTNALQYNTGSFEGPGPTPGDVPVPDLGPRVWALIAAAVVAVVLVALAFGIVGAIMEFVLVESLRNEAVAVRRYWRRRWRQGLRLFGFRILLGLVTLAVVAVLAGIAFLPLVAGSGEVSVVAFLAVFPAFVVVALAAGLVNGFTTVFVVPIMIAEDAGVLAAWRAFWPTLRSEWKQYAAYAVAGFVLSIAGGIIVGIVVAILAVLLLIPFGIAGAVGFAFLAALPIVGWAVIAVVALVYLLAVLTAVAFAQVPVVTYLRYYALFVLGDTNDAFDLVAERREAVRE